MPSPKIFLSSTCYDLGMVREQLRSFFLRLGYDPILSEYSDVLYDPRTHTHTSCMQEVPNADIVVVLIGSRFGGQAVPEALRSIDIENLLKSSFDVAVLTEPEKLSITQLEVLKAIDATVPVFAFVDEKVMHDHFVYQKNKGLVEKITFPSIETPQSARYIFEFISFLHQRNKGNSVIPFGRIEDIENHLLKQWGALFQKLLREQRDHTQDSRKLFTISEQIEDIKTAIISSIGNAQSRDVARSVIKYRRLTDFLSGLSFPDRTIVTEGVCGFEELLKAAGVIKVRNIRDQRPMFGQGFGTRNAYVNHLFMLVFHVIDRRSDAPQIGLRQSVPILWEVMHRKKEGEVAKNNSVIRRLRHVFAYAVRVPRPWVYKPSS